MSRAFFLPLLRRGHQRCKLVGVESPHGKVVQQEVCTERDADIYAMLETVALPCLPKEQFVDAKQEYLYTCHSKYCIPGVLRFHLNCISGACFLK